MRSQAHPPHAMTEPQLRAAYHAHKDAIYRFAWRMTGESAAAEDIVQETFLSIMRDPDRFDPLRAPLRAFFLAIARNLARKRWRNEQIGMRWTKNISWPSRRMRPAERPRNWSGRR